MTSVEPDHYHPHNMTFQLVFILEILKASHKNGDSPPSLYLISALLVPVPEQVKVLQMHHQEKNVW